MSLAEIEAGLGKDDNVSMWSVLKAEVVHPKWRMLFFICMLYFGKQFIYDFPSSFGMGEGATIESRFSASDVEYNNRMNQALYSIYAYPNMILALAGGILIDKILGIRKSVVLFSTLITVGALIFWIGVQTVQYPVMVLGRFVLGLGGEAIAVAKTAFIARWFYGGRGMSFAYGVTITGIRLGSSLNFLISPTVASSQGVDIACLVGVAFCAFSTVCTLILVVMDRHYEKTGFLPAPAASLANKPAANLTICQQMRLMPRQIRGLSLQYWLLVGVCLCLYGSDLPFIGFAKNYFQVKWGLSSTDAGLAMSVYQLVSAFASPFTGALIDKIGRNAIVLLISCTLFTMTHVILAWSMLAPIVIMVMQGVFFSLMIPSLWPAVPVVVDAKLVAVGFGLMMSIQNVGIATIPLLVGSILDAHTLASNSTLTNTSALRSSQPDATPEGYFKVEVLMLGIGAVGCLLALVLLCYDLKRSRLLAVSPDERRQRLREMDEERRGLLDNDALTGDVLRE